MGEVASHWGWIGISRVSDVGQLFTGLWTLRVSLEKRRYSSPLPILNRLLVESQSPTRPGH